MRRKSRFFLLVGGVVFLLSCTTTGTTTSKTTNATEAATKPPLTVELFDTRIPEIPSGDTSAGESNDLASGVDAPKVAEPAATETVAEPAATETVAEPAATETVAEPAATETVAELSLEASEREPQTEVGPLHIEPILRLPTMPQTDARSSVEVEYSVASVQAVRAKALRYAFPEAPSAFSPKPGAGSTPVQARKQTPAQTFLSAPAASTTPTAPAAPLSTGQALPAASGRVREIYARQGDEVRIGLEGPGFLFLGFPDKAVQRDGMSFKGKETKSGKTFFTFKAMKLGVYDLDFLQQDNSAGKTVRETVRVHVVSDQEFASAVENPGQEAGGGKPLEAGDAAYAEKLSSLGVYEAAIAELLKGYREGDARTTDRLASLYMRTADYEVAEKYYSKNLTPANPFWDNAVLGLVRIAIARKDQKELLSHLKQLLSVRDPSAEEIFIQAVRFEKEGRQIGVGLELAAEYAKRYPAGRWRDEADFLAAQLLELDSQFRDISRARDLYQGILRIFPESPFADPARERLQYIERHFFQVR